MLLVKVGAHIVKTLGRAIYGPMQTANIVWIVDISTMTYILLQEYASLESIQEGQFHAIMY